MSNLLELSKERFSKIPSKFKESNKHAGSQGVILRFYDLLCILSQKYYRECESV